jgi:hypothetical protein
MIDTTSTYHVAYVVVAVIYAVYAFSLWARSRRLRERVDGDARRPAARGE